MAAGGGEDGRTPPRDRDRDPPQDSYYQPRGLEKHTDSVLALVSAGWGGWPLTHTPPPPTV